MSLFDAAADASRAFNALRDGGVAIVPHTIGYSALGSTRTALERIFNTKKRAAGKLNAMVGNLEIHRQVHRCSTRAREIVEAVTLDYGLPLGCIAPANLEHPLLSSLGPDMLERSTKEGTVVMLMNGGACHRHLTALSLENNVPLFGSSANVSLTGTKFCVEDIEPEIIAIADVVVDHGLQCFHPYGASSTLLNVETLEVTRVGSCYEDIRYILSRHFAHELPPRVDT
ncbi:MAG: Sua5/YciO/YrdC/YwlC family protein [Alphaproteobacteria bacterium]|nr:Sua5/YciO/YrdC/YwlC family protein [Alphaproteobacteria bacterium]